MALRKSNGLQKLALACLYSGNKKVALRHAREMKLANDSRDKCATFMNRVVEVLDFIANAEMTKKVSEAIQIGAKAINENRISIQEVEDSPSKISLQVSILLIRRLQDEREVLPSNSEGSGASTAAVTLSHGIEVAVEFKPVEHPMEPLDNDRPIQCPLPEPSILNDGRIWKERVSATVPRRGDLPVMMEGGSLEPETAVPKSRSTRPNRMILPSLSAPEHNILNLREECNAASGI